MYWISVLGSFLIIGVTYLTRVSPIRLTDFDPVDDVLFFFQNLDPLDQVSILR